MITATLPGGKIHLTKGDITEMETDAIVNPANSQLILGGGVAGAIRKKGGPAIQEECNQLAPIAVGEAVITTGGQLKAKKVIHAVGPRNGEGNEEEKLRNATRNSLLVAEKNGLTSLTFPAISTGIFGYPVDKCANVMLSECLQYLKKPGGVRDIYFCLWDDKTFEVFRATLDKLNAQQ